MAGGHPRESLEASFDIVHEDISRVQMIEAELLLVTSQAIGLLRSSTLSTLKVPLQTPLWFIRLNHTRLLDSILDLIGIPVHNNVRRSCFHIISRFVAPAPHTVASHVLKVHTKQISTNGIKMLDKVNSVVKELGMLLLSEGAIVSF